MKNNWYISYVNESLHDIIAFSETSYYLGIYNINRNMYLLAYDVLS